MRPLLSACRLLLAASPAAPLVNAHEAADAVAWPPPTPPRPAALDPPSSPDAPLAPGVPYRVHRLQAALAAHYASYASGPAARHGVQLQDLGPLAPGAAHTAHWASVLGERSPGAAWRKSVGLPEAPMADGLEPPPKRGKMPRPPP